MLAVAVLAKGHRVEPEVMTRGLVSEQSAEDAHEHPPEIYFGFNAFNQN